MQAVPTSWFFTSVTLKVVNALVMCMHSTRNNRNDTTYLYRADFSVLGKHLRQLDVIVLLTDVLDVDVSKPSSFFAQLMFAILAGNEASNVDFLAVQQHSIDLLDGTQGRFFSFEMDKSIAFALAVRHVSSDFAAQDVAESGEGVVHGLVVDGLVQVLDEDVANTGATETGVTLAPHDPDGFAFEYVKVHGVQGPFSCKESIF